MALVINNTGSWYQNVYRRKILQGAEPAPIAWFRVCSDILDARTSLSVEHICDEINLLLSVTNNDVVTKIIQSVENLDSVISLKLSVSSTYISPVIVSVENIVD